MNIPEYLEKLAREQGFTEEQAAAIRKRAGERLHLPESVAARHWKQIRTATEEEEKRLEDLHKMSEEWERESGRVKNLLHEIRVIIDDWSAKNIFAEGSFIVTSFEWAARFLTGVYQKLKDIRTLGLAEALKKSGVNLKPVERPMPGATAPQRLMSTGGAREETAGMVSDEVRKEVSSTAELLRQFRRLNALLSGEEQPIPDLSEQGGLASQLGVQNIKSNLAFHNAPMGGAQGESNPIQLPTDAAQPGGGAQAEARQPLLRPYQPGDPSRGTYVSKGVTKQYPILSAAATPLAPQFPGEATYSGVSRGRGVASWFGMDPRFQTQVDPSDPFGSNALRVPERFQGISLSTGKSGELGTSGQTLGQQHYVYDPNTGLTYVKQQTDVGPGVRTQKLVDVSAAMAARIETASGATGYTKKTFEEMQGKVERGEIAPWEVSPTGFGTYGRPGFEGKDITAPMQKNVDPTTTTQNIYELDTKRLLNPSLGYRPNYAGGTGPIAVPKGLEGAPATAGAGTTFGGGAGAFDVSGSEWMPPSTYPEEGLQKGLRIPKSEILMASTEPAPPADRPVGFMSTPALDRRTLDRELGDESNVELSANLNVNVRAPAGTEVKADGNGMFKNNVSLDRELPTLQ
jgi:hypothetical protein